MTQQAAELYGLLQAEEIDEQTYLDTIAAIGVDDKLEAYCQVLTQLKADLDMFKNEKARIDARRATCENSIDRMKQAMLLYMHSTQQDKAKAGTFSISIRKTKAVNIIDPSVIPEQYLIAQEPKIDKMAIKEALNNGEAVAGAEIQENEGVTVR